MAQKKGKKAGCPTGEVFNQKLKKCVKADTPYEKKMKRRHLTNPQSKHYVGPDLTREGPISRKEARVKGSL